MEAAVDWERVIGRNGGALRRILAMLRARVGEAEFLPRIVHRAVLRLLRPAERAARRLVIVAARDIAVTLPPPRPRTRPSSAILRDGIGTGIILPRGTTPPPRGVPAGLPPRGVPAGLPPRGVPAGLPPRSGPAGLRPRCLSLPLLDPRPRLRRRAAAPCAQATSGVPRILFPGVSAPRPVAPWRPPSPDDPIATTRLLRRLAAVGRALDDLAGHARRFARWRARRDRALALRLPHRLPALRPLRPRAQAGAPPQQPRHEVEEVLADLHHFAVEALLPCDTS
jgi:hypothetical protein